MLGVIGDINNKEFSEMYANIQRQAAKSGYIFYANEDDCREFIDNGMNQDNLQGWLVPYGACDSFATRAKKRELRDSDSKYRVCALLSNGKVSFARL